MHLDEAAEYDTVEAGMLEDMCAVAWPTGTLSHTHQDCHLLQNKDLDRMAKGGEHVVRKPIANSVSAFRHFILLYS